MLSLVSASLCASAFLFNKPILALVFAVLSAAAGVLARVL
jgi:hypothetical protein